ncbi:MAG: hypothetical protein M1817_002743 [Caeruleum heppii]|nr:MAG: hypothetical protein M1817_002743 [Caeruleum heppii]
MLDDGCFMTSSDDALRSPSSVRLSNATSRSSRSLSALTRRTTSHHIRPPPGRRRRAAVTSFPSLSVQALLSTIFLLLCFVSSTIATPAEDGLLLDSTLARLARRGEIAVDRRPRPEASALRRRQTFNSPFSGSPSPDAAEDAAPPSSTSQTTILPPTPSPETPSPTESSTSSTSTTSRSTPESSSIMMAPSASSMPLPSAFDTSLGSNFTSQNCPNFFYSFLGNTTFQSCLPFSLLLKNSNSFFQASKSIYRVTQTLDTSCNVDFDMCSSLMSTLAEQLRAASNCGPDFDAENAIVLQAYHGLVAYRPFYQAGCLKSSTGSYCFADAITNVASPTDSYIYYLGLGMDLPAGTRPTCNDCLRNTLKIFANAAASSTQPASGTYVESAQLVQLSCGPEFANTTIPVLKSAAGVAGLKTSSLGLLWGVAGLVAGLALL